MGRSTGSDGYENYVVSLLGARKFLTGNELNQLLSVKFGIQAENARTIIRRIAGKGLIKSSKPLTFGNGQFIYLDKDEKLTRERLMQIAQKYRKSMFNLLEAMGIDGGIISYYEGLKVTASPLQKGSTKVDSLDDIVNDLVEAEVLVVKKDENGVKYIIDATTEPDDIDTLMYTHYMKMVEDALFLPDVLRWLQGNNLIDNKMVVYRNKKTPFKGGLHNNLIWDAFSYTRTTGINPTFGKAADTTEKQTLVAIDMVIHRDYSQADLDGFYNRIQINLNSVKTGVRKVMPLIIYKNAPPSVLNKIRGLGFLAFDLGAVFGTKINSVIQNLHFLQATTADGEYNMQVVLTATRTLETIRATGQEDALRAVKGTLFEYLLYPVIRDLYPNTLIERGRSLPTIEDGKKKTYEFDYIVRGYEEIVIIELKGVSGKSQMNLGDTDTKNTVKWFFDRTFPVARKHFDSDAKQGVKITACLITSGSFRQEAQTYLEKLSTGKLKPKGIELAYNGNELVIFLKTKGYKKEADIIEKYYINQDPDRDEEGED